MIQELRESPKCRKCGKTLEWLPWTGKPLPPVDPKTKKPCGCSGGNVVSGKTGRMYDKKDKYEPCPYCDGHYHIEDGNENHEQIYHKDKKVHAGEYDVQYQCFTDEILYHGDGDHWYLMHMDEKGEFLSVDGKENVEEFILKYGIKHVMDYVVE